MSDSAKVLDISQALEEFEARPELAEALKKALDANLDLAVAPDSELLTTDAAQKSRLIYVVSLLRFLAFLREPATQASKKEAQAKLAMAYIRHAETTNAASQAYGRSVKDKVLEEEINKLRQGITAVAEAKARLNVH